MKRHYLQIIALILATALAQLAAEGGLDFFNGKLNFALAALILLINFATPGAVVASSVAIGLILDLYSGLPFGLLTISLFFTAVMLEILFVNFFTNFSFYSLMILGALAVAIYNVLFVGLAVSAYFIGWSDVVPGWSYGWRVGWQFLTTEILLIAAFGASSFVSRRFRPMFLR